MKLQVGRWITILTNERDERALVLCVKEKYLVIMIENHYIVIFNWNVIDDRIVWENGKRFDDFMDMAEYIVEKSSYLKHLDSVLSGLKNGGSPK